MNACKFSGTAEIMYEENHLNEAYPSQGATPGSLQGLLLIFASAQRNLHTRYKG